jgi:hypothetical protein
MNLEDLIGKWKIFRTLSSLDGSPEGKMRGMGQFELYEGTTIESEFRR